MIGGDGEGRGGDYAAGAEQSTPEQRIDPRRGCGGERQPQAAHDAATVAA